MIRIRDSYANLGIMVDDTVSYRSIKDAHLKYDCYVTCASAEELWSKTSLE